MAKNLPTASIKGQQEWRWNQLQAERRSTETPTGASNEPPSRIRERNDRERAVDRQREVEDLEAELERKEEHLNEVIERYERLLEKKNQQIANRRSPQRQSDAGSSSVSKVLQFITDR